MAVSTRACCWALLLAFATPCLAQGERWEVPEAGMSLEIPAGWQIVENQTGRKMLRRLDGAGAGFAESVAAALAPARASSAEELKGAVRQQVERDGIELLSSEVKQLAGRDVVVLDFQGAMRGVSAHWHLVAFLQGEIQVVVTATVLQDRWESSKASIEAMFAGIEIGEPAPPEPRARALHPTSGVSVVPPHGWVQLPNLAGGMWDLARWGFTQDGRQMQALLVLRGEPVPEGATLTGAAEQVAKGVGGAVAGELDLGGTPALVVANDQATGQQPRRVLVSVREGVAYSLALIGPARAAPVWKQVVQSWQWHEREDASLHCGTLGAPLPVGKAMFLIPPGLMRTMGRGEGEMRLGLHDYKHARGGLMVQIKGMGLGDSAVTLETLRSQVTTQLSAQLKVDASKIVWEERRGEVPAYLSAPVKGEGGELLLFSILRPSAEVAVMINFIIYDPTPTGQAAYREACRRLIASARTPPR